MPHSDPASDPQKLFRCSKRLSVTVAHSTLEALEDRSLREGRSLSNLAAFLLESALDRSGG